MTDMVDCPACSTPNPFGNRFCRKCGVAMDGATWNEEAGSQAEGYVEGGVWNRPPGEFVRRVELKDMRSSLGRKSLRVPRGSIGVVMLDGALKEVLPPGLQTTVGWGEQLLGLFSDRMKRTDFFLVDLRPLPIPFTAQIRTPETGQSTRYRILVEISVLRDDWGALNVLLDQTLAGESCLSAKALYDRLSPYVQEASKRTLAAAESGELDLKTVEERIAEELRPVCQQRGLGVQVHISPVATLVSLDFQLGTAPAPAVKSCVECGAEIASSKKFCTSCGGEQPIVQQPSRVCSKCGQNVKPEKKFCTGCGTPYEEPDAAAKSLFTRDGQQVELDLVLRAEGEYQAAAIERIGAVLWSAAAKRLRNTDFDTLSSAEGFKELEEGLVPDIEASLRGLGLTVVDLTVLDLRSKTGEWLLGARSQLERARQEITLGREWLEVEEQNVDLKALSLDMALRSQRAERDHLFNLDKEELADRRRRQELADGGAELDVADAQRDAHRDIAVDRAVSADDHMDRMQTMGRDLAGEANQATHEMAMEREVAKHDADLARQASELKSEEAKRQVEDEGHATRTRAEADAHANRVGGETEAHVARAKQEVELEAEQSRQAMQMDKLKQMAELDAQIREQEMKEQAQARDHELQMRQQLKGLTTEQMLAMQADGQSAEHIAAALAEKFKADGASAEKTTEMQREFYERMMTEMKAGHETATAASREKDNQMFQLMQQMQQSMEHTTTAALGGQQAANEAAKQAQDQSVQQAVSMSEKSMSAMSNVAAAAASPAPVGRQRRGSQSSRKEEPKGGAVCSSCGAKLELDDEFCGGCGTTN